MRAAASARAASGTLADASAKILAPVALGVSLAGIVGVVRFAVVDLDTPPAVLVSHPRAPECWFARPGRSDIAARSLESALAVLPSSDRVVISWGLGRVIAIGLISLFGLVALVSEAPAASVGRAALSVILVSEPEAVGIHDALVVALHVARATLCARVGSRHTVSVVGASGPVASWVVPAGSIARVVAAGRVRSGSHAFSVLPVAAHVSFARVVFRVRRAADAWRPRTVSGVRAPSAVRARAHGVGAHRRAPIAAVAAGGPLALVLVLVVAAALARAGGCSLNLAAALRPMALLVSVALNEVLVAVARLPGLVVVSGGEAVAAAGNRRPRALGPVVTLVLVVVGRACGKGVVVFNASAGDEVTQCVLLARVEVGVFFAAAEVGVLIHGDAPAAVRVAHPGASRNIIALIVRGVRASAGRRHGDAQAVFWPSHPLASVLLFAGVVRASTALACRATRVSRVAARSASFTVLSAGGAALLCKHGVEILHLGLDIVRVFLESALEAG